MKGSLVFTAGHEEVFIQRMEAKRLDAALEAPHPLFHSLAFRRSDIDDKHSAIRWAIKTD